MLNSYRTKSIALFLLDHNLGKTAIMLEQCPSGKRDKGSWSSTPWFLLTGGSAQKVGHHFFAFRAFQMGALYSLKLYLKQILKTGPLSKKTTNPLLSFAGPIFGKNSHNTRRNSRWEKGTKANGARQFSFC